ncbi:hypothetical protein ACC712_38790, partial [Rhizobium ruizarguesonis]
MLFSSDLRALAQALNDRHGAPFKTTTRDWQARFSIFKDILLICERSAFQFNRITTIRSDLHVLAPIVLLLKAQ